MTLTPVPGFVALKTHHCVTGSLRHIYHYYGHPFSEELLLGLGAGVGFVYWHTRGNLPFIGGRANLERPGVEGLEKAVGRRTGVLVNTFRTESTARAEADLLEKLRADQPVMLVLDMGFLPYFDFRGEEYHFGQHVVVACGYDQESGQVLIADRDAKLHPVSLADLAKARNSRYQPFPPHNTWYTFDFDQAHPPEAAEIWQAIHDCATGMLEPPISNLGIKGIAKAAQRILHWPQLLNEKQLRDTCLYTAIMIDARGGSGGGLFRYMYGRFLSEVSELTSQPALSAVGEQMQAIGDQWQRAADIFERAASSANPAQSLSDVSTLFRQIAELESSSWHSLLQLTASNQPAATPTN